MLVTEHEWSPFILSFSHSLGSWMGDIFLFGYHSNAGIKMGVTQTLKYT